MLVIFGEISGKSNERQITLSEALFLAETQSVDALLARNVFLSAYWRYRNYRAELLPNVVFDATLPSLNRSLSAYQKQDGTYGFIPSRSLSENTQLSVSQNIPFTGGTLSLQSQLQRIDQLDGDKTTSYLSIPLSLTFNQPLISTRTLKWSMKIEPERYREAQQQYLVDIESIHIKTINYYFDLLLAMINHTIAEINFENATKLFDIAQGKKAIGLISDNELLQLELGRINAEASVITAQQVYDSKMLSIRNFLREESKDDWIPVIPSAYIQPEISLNRVLDLAYDLNPVNHTIQRCLLESRMYVDQAKANRGFRADVYMSLGYTNSDSKLPDSYKRLENRQIVSLGVRIPIIDWGRGKGGVKLAQSELEVVKSQMEQMKLNFEQNVTLSVSQYLDQAKLTTLAQQADSIAQLRYETVFRIFVMGKINVLDINSAQVERDDAHRKYINELYLSWLCYYNLRQITLYDFEQNKPLGETEMQKLKL
jgi:outer membrane protein TolC